MTILRETVRRYHLGNGTFRVWRQVDEWLVTTPGPDPDVASLLRGQEFDTMILAKTILSLPNVNAVEIVDDHGNGEVLYKDWP